MYIKKHKTVINLLILRGLFSFIKSPCISYHNKYGKSSLIFAKKHWKTHRYIVLYNIDTYIFYGKLVNHPKYAVMYASKYFDLSEKEKDIITTHMFPVAMHTIPKYAESWIVNIVDNFVAICEALYTARFRCMKYANVMMIVVLNFLR